MLGPCGDCGSKHQASPAFKISKMQGIIREIMNTKEGPREVVWAKMKAWKLVDETECGYWVYVGKVEELHGCVVDWVAHNKDGKPLPLSVSGQYVTIQVPKSGYKELFHRQLYQDLTNCELPPKVEIHHVDGNPVNNVIGNLQAVPQTFHRRLHRQER